MANTLNGENVNVDMQGGVGGIRQKEEEQRAEAAGDSSIVSDESPYEMPEYIDMPSPSFISYDPITRAPYKMQNIRKFAKTWGRFNRRQITQNYELANELALKQLDTELKGLQSYVPAAAALKRSETAADNIFNQEQRLAQVNKVLPEAYKQLQAQGARAESFASGRMPSSIEDRALELNMRSQAADAATAGGFGARSSAARKASDLLSAQQRIALSQYGDQLLTGNIATKANLYLAPTQYSNVGAEIRATPSISGSQLASNNLANINQLTMISPTTALGAKIQEKQFVAGLEQQTLQFNASNELASDQFNASTANQFKLTKFQYDVGMAGTEAGIATANNVYANDLQLMERYGEIVGDNADKARDSDMWGAVASGLAQVGSTIVGSMMSGANAGGGNNLRSGAGTGGGQSYSLGDAMYSSEGGAVPSATTTKAARGVTSQPLDVTTPSVSAGPIELSGGGAGEPAAVVTKSAGYSGPIQSFSSDANISLPDDVGSNQQVTRELINGSNVVLNSSGISNTPLPGMQYVGANYSGGATYVAPRMLLSSNTDSGRGLIATNATLLDTLGVLDQADNEKLVAAADTSADTDILSELDTAAQSGNFKTFANKLLQATDKPTLDTISKKKDIEGLTAAYTAHQLFQNWGSISPEQKSLAVASLSLQNAKDSKGQKITEKTLPATEGTGYKPLKVNEALKLVKKGYNVAPLAADWELNNDIHTLAGGHSDPEDVAMLSQGLGLIGRGSDGQAVRGVNAKNLAGSGWAASPHIGVGAITGSTKAAIPQGYTQITANNTRRVAAPTVSIPTVASGDTSGSLLNTKAGYGGVSDDAQAVYKRWKDSGVRKANNGVVGGSAVVSGLYGISNTNPILFASTVASSFVNPKKNIDYGSDGEYFGYLGAVSLGRLTEGEKVPAKLDDTLKVAMSDAKVKKLDEVSFAKMAVNLRAQYAKAGIKSKADAYGLANQAFAEKRINAADLVGMQKVFNAIYDSKGFDTAKKLITGRERGIELAKKKGRSTGIPKANKAAKTEVTKKAAPVSANLTKEDIRALNKRRYQMQAQGAAA